MNKCEIERTLNFDTTFTYSGPDQNIECNFIELKTSVYIVIQNSSFTLFYTPPEPLIAYTITFFTNDGKVIGSEYTNSSRQTNGLDFTSKRETRILMIGLDGAGKSTLLYKLKLGDKQFENLSMTVLDIGGQNKIGALWKQYYQGSNAVVFVVNCTDRERISQEVIKEIDNLLIQGIHLLIFANKQDMNGAIDTTEIVNSLNLNSIKIEINK
ncbi:hypothetical protein ACTA71_009323 [Dictyostelium dimigraforme]